MIAVALTLAALLGTALKPLSALPASATPRNYGIVVDVYGQFRTGSTDLGIDCDDCTKEIGLPFTVNVYGTNYTTAVVSSNGNVQFTTNNAAYANTCLPNAAMGVMIAPYWDDLTTATVPEDGVFSAVHGESPNRTFTIEWRAHLVSNGNTVQVRLIFAESPTGWWDDPNFSFDASEDNKTVPVGSGATMGLQRFDRGLHRQHSCNTAQDFSVYRGLRVILAPPVADFDGNGSTDVAVFRPNNGTWQVRNGQIVQWGATGDRPAPADYDNDGDSDIAVFRPSSGTWFIRNGPTLPFGTNGDIPVPGPYISTGVGWGTLPVVFRPSTGTWFFSSVGALQWGTSGDIPVPADYDGDGLFEPAVFRPSNGYWFVHGGATVQFGANGDIPVPGDYTGDGIAEMAVFRPSNGYWFIRNGPTVQWGASGDIPVPGHYDGDPFKIAVFRPSNGYWFVRNGPTVQFGANGDVPLAKPLGST